VPSRTFGRSDYHSMQTKLDRRFRNGILFTNSYTLGRARNFADDNGGIATPADIERSYGLAGFDRRHTWVSSFVVDLPFFREADNFLLKSVLGGWQVSGLLSLTSGTPLSVTADGALLRAPGNTLYADRVGDPEVLGNFGPGQLYFNTSAFAQPAPATFGNTNRNGSGLRGPGFTALDFSLVKRMRFGASRLFELRGDAFNLTNTPNWNNPNTSLASPQYGQISGASNQRVVRLALKFAF
jgi:hypothetical protein